MAASKITDARSRSAHSIRTARSVVANALLASDKIGVTPLPPAKASNGIDVGLKTNVPAALVMASSLPSTTLSTIQLETLPPATRFTVVISSVSVSGALDIEYDRYSSSPSTVTLKVQNWPAR